MAVVVFAQFGVLQRHLESLAKALSSSRLGSIVGRKGARRTKKRIVETDEGLSPKKGLVVGNGTSRAAKRRGRGRKERQEVRRRLEGGKGLVDQGDGR